MTRTSIYSSRFSNRRRSSGTTLTPAPRSASFTRVGAPADGPGRRRDHVLAENDVWDPRARVPSCPKCSSWREKAGFIQSLVVLFNGKTRLTRFSTHQPSLW